MQEQYGVCHYLIAKGVSNDKGKPPSNLSDQYASAASYLFNLIINYVTIDRFDNHIKIIEQFLF